MLSLTLCLFSSSWLILLPEWETRQRHLLFILITDFGLSYFSRPCFVTAPSLISLNSFSSNLESWEVPAMINKQANFHIWIFSCHFMSIKIQRKFKPLLCYSSSFHCQLLERAHHTCVPQFFTAGSELSSYVVLSAIPTFLKLLAQRSSTASTRL